MQWSELLSHERLKRPDAVPQEGRTAFQQDMDRIVFSASFRRLAHKTQVHPLSQNDHVHTRLTHSVEVASVGRSLGTIVGTEIAKNASTAFVNPNWIGDIVAAACLAHDIGNPPFGHSGEEAIQNWFSGAKAKNLTLTSAERADFHNFDGNAQGFRILTNLENRRFDGGLQLTVATLGAYSKYPRGGGDKLVSDNYPAGKKVGIFQSELSYFEEVASRLGLPRRDTNIPYWSRHPLAFLVEAADDICYSIIDIEDGYMLGFIDFAEATEILEPVAEEQYRNLERGEQIAKLRAVAIGNLVRECAKVFSDHLKELSEGSFSNELLDLTRFCTQISKAKTTARDRVYWSRTKAKLELAGSEIISGLLDTFSDIVAELELKKFDHDRLSTSTQRLMRLRGGKFSHVRSTYDGMLSITDSISAMTDRYALDLYRALRGISL